MWRTCGEHVARDYRDLEREGAGLSSVESRERRRPRDCDRERGRGDDGGLCSRSEAGRLGDLSALLVKSISIRSPLVPVHELRLKRLAIDIMAFIPFINNNTARADNVNGSAGIMGKI